MQLSLDGAIMRPVLKKERRNWLLPEPLRAQPGLEAFSSVFRQILHGRGVTRQSQLDPWLQTDLERAPKSRPRTGRLFEFRGGSMGSQLA